MTRFLMLSIAVICLLPSFYDYCYRKQQFICRPIEQEQLCPVIEWKTIRPETLVVEPTEQDKPAIHLYGIYGE